MSGVAFTAAVKRCGLTDQAAKKFTEMVDDDISDLPFADTDDFKGSLQILKKARMKEMKYAKNKYRTSLTDANLKNTLRLSTTSIVPNIEELVDRHQWHNK